MGSAGRKTGAAVTFSPLLAGRARRATSGTCMLCGCTDDWGCVEGCAWVPGTSNRICTAHHNLEVAQARAALEAADHPKPKTHRKEA